MEGKIFVLKLKEEELNLVLGALGELPAKTSIRLIQNIHQQVSSQINPSKVVAEPVKTDPVKTEAVKAEDKKIKEK